MESLLQFLYTDELPTSSLEDVSALVYLAKAGDRYQLQVLVARCVERVRGLLCPESAASVLLEAHKAGLGLLKKMCLDFITGSQTTLRAVQDSVEFDRLHEDAPALLLELFVASCGNGKRRRSSGASTLEFPAGSD